MANSHFAGLIRALIGSTQNFLSLVPSEDALYMEYCNSPDNSDHQGCAAFLWMDLEWLHYCQYSLSGKEAISEGGSSPFQYTLSLWSRPALIARGCEQELLAVCKHS